MFVWHDGYMKLQLLHRASLKKKSFQINWESVGWQMIQMTLTADVKKGKVHPCTGTEALYRLYSPLEE